MKSILELLSDRVRAALARVGVEGDPQIQASQDETFGDYQSNAALGLAKKLARKPREVAEAIVEKLEIDDLCERPEIAGPGFINFRLQPSFLARSLQSIATAGDLDTDRVGLPPTEKPEVIVVDLSSPNLAKEMHVGHLRSTVIGDCVARVLEFQGHTVHRENHVGDWGTQFGMLLAHLRRVRPEVVDRPGELVIRDLESFYIEAKARFDADEKFKEESRETVVALQRGDATTRRIWKAFCDESLRHCHAIYDRLGVRLIDRGESYYNQGMNEVVCRLEKLRDNGRNDAVRDSDGALCVFLDGFTTREGQPLPLMVRKSDGGFNYATSDLATILDRVETLKATRIVYVVGLAQKQHFEMLFAAGRKVGWVGPDVRLEHLGFGNMLSKAGTPFKTREGGTVKLKDLLDEAVARARRVVEEQGLDETGPRRSFTPQQMDAIAETVGLAAVKYFDLSHSMTSDYRFDLDTMLAMEGNTAPYMLYAYARIRSIGRKAGVDFRELPSDVPILLNHPSEIALAKKLLQFADAIEVVGRELRPNVLTDYLYDLAKAFSRFYDKKLGVRVIDATPESVRTSRLRLCDIAARVLRLGLRLLGIDTIEQM
ncbi:MAG: arginine--tRNA ligase [Planctomycetota bacterium]